MFPDVSVCVACRVVVRTRRLGRELQTFGIMLIRRLWMQHAAVEKDIRPNCLQDVLLEQLYCKQFCCSQ